MSQQPAKEWDDMSEQTRNEIKARLMTACDTKVDAANYVLRQRLANASRPALAEHLARLA